MIDMDIQTSIDLEIGLCFVQTKMNLLKLTTNHLKNYTKHKKDLESL